MDMTVTVENVQLRAMHEDKRGNRLVDATVHFAIRSDLGDLRIAVPVDGCQGFDWAVQNARDRLGKWAGALTQAAKP